jgi:acylphosphatase
VKAWFRVHGRVQGVGFRRFVQGQAEALGLAGWVRNEPDGSVAGEAAGDLSRLEAFRDHLAEGPGWGRVTSLDWSTAPGGESLPQPFEIRN